MPLDRLELAHSLELARQGLRMDPNLFSKQSTPMTGGQDDVQRGMTARFPGRDLPAPERPPPSGECLLRVRQYAQSGYCWRWELYDGSRGIAQGHPWATEEAAIEDAEWILEHVLRATQNLQTKETKMSEIDYEVETTEQEDEMYALTKVTSAGDPAAFVAALEKEAALAERRRAAMETLIVSRTYAGDWSTQGTGDKAKACLSSAGAERIVSGWPIHHRDVVCKKEDFEDKLGKGYRYTYSGYASFQGAEIYVHGSYSSRDKLLGSVSGEWKPVEEVDEVNIRNAAYHRFSGNGIKALLGLAHRARSRQVD
jgi:hypothetical protein